MTEPTPNAPNPTPTPQSPSVVPSAPDSGQPPQPGAQPAPAATAAAPDGLDTRFWDAEKGALKTDEWIKHTKELEAFKAAQDVRLAGVPEKPDGYQIEAPADLKLPEGVSIDLDPARPEWKVAREIAHGLKLDQAGFNQLVKAHVELKAQEFSIAQQAVQEEMKKVGSNAAQVIDSVRVSLVSHIGEGRARALALGVSSAEGLQGLQMLLSKLSSSGVTPASPAASNPGREKSLAEIFYPSMATKR